MTDIYGRRPKQGNAMLKALIILVGLGAIAAVIYAGLAYVSDPRVQSRMAETRFEREYLENQQFGHIIQKLKTEFPEDYEGLKYNITEAYKTGASADQKNDLFFQFMNRFLEKHVHEIALAPAANLKEVRDTQLDTLVVLQGESDRACAWMVTATDGLGARFGPAATAAVNRETTALIDAAIAGRKTPVKPRGPMTPADYRLLGKGMDAEGLTAAHHEILVKGDLARVSDRDACTIGLIILRSLTRLPPDVADRATIDLLQSA